MKSSRNHRKHHERQDTLAFIRAPLQQALRRPGCAVCHVVRDWEQRSLFSFLYEGMTVAPARQKFLDGGGFCSRHFWLATHLGVNFWSVGGFEVANLCAPLVAKAQVEIERVEAWRGRARRVVLWKSRDEIPTALPGRACVFCAEIRRREKGLIELLEKLVQGEEFARQFAASALCFRHTHLAVNMWKNPSTRAQLAKAFRRSTDELIRELNEFIRKHEHQHRHEPFAREADVVARVMEFLVGWESSCSFENAKSDSASIPAEKAAEV